MTDWLPTSRKELEMRGWDEVDVVLFSGDAYVDHPSFGAAVIGRIIESKGFSVAIVPQPNWRDDLRDFKKFGTPRLFFAISAGCMDSMVNHYTANLRRRSDDAYTPGGAAGFRPDYAMTTYSQIIKKLYPDTPLLIGGIEASLRRVAHYDYWSNSLKQSVLVDSGADLLVYGMGEKPLSEILSLLKKGVPFHKITSVPQTVYKIPRKENPQAHKSWKDYELHSYESCKRTRANYASNFKKIEEASNRWEAERLVQGNGDYKIVINPPYHTASTEEIDSLYDLPFTRLPHPRYTGKGPIPAYEMIKFSINIHRGCFGGCSFCTISAHQGKHVVSRSTESVLREVKRVTEMPDFKGYLSDIGGPSANMYQMRGKDLKICEQCKRPSCIYPVICSNLNVDYSPLIDLYKKVRQVEGIKKAFVGSGVRYDMLFDKSGNIPPARAEYAAELIRHHVSGRLKVAPEHTSEEVLKVMRKPSFEYFKKFKTFFDVVNRKFKLNQELIPYFISSHPGSTDSAMAELAIQMKELDFKLEQVQDFTPTPMTLSSAIFYSGVHPYTLEKVFTPLSQEMKIAQRRFFFWYKRENVADLKKTLSKIGRTDLINKLFNKK